MLAQKWIKQAQNAGWRVESVNGLEMRLACAVLGCPGHFLANLHDLPDIPAKCAEPHEQGYAAPVFDTYRDMVAELRKRRRVLGLDQADLCNAMGLADGYINKLEAFDRTASSPTLLLWAQSLGVTFTTTPSTLPPATIRAIDQRSARPYAPNQARFKYDNR